MNYEQWVRMSTHHKRRRKHGSTVGGRFTVLLDPAHGGHDTGHWEIVEGVHIFEKDLTLKFTDALIAQMPEDIQPLVTRDRDIWLTNRQRATAKDHHYDLLISFHVHRLEIDKVPGVYACVMDKDDDLASAIAECLVNALAEGLGIAPAAEEKRLLESDNLLFKVAQERRDKKGYPLSVLRWQGLPKWRRPSKKWGTPAVSIILGHIDVPEELKALRSAARIKKAAKKVVGILTQLNKEGENGKTAE